jgi:hypothetical protein
MSSRGAGSLILMKVEVGFEPVGQDYGMKLRPPKQEVHYGEVCDHRIGRSGRVRPYRSGR